MRVKSGGAKLCKGSVWSSSVVFGSGKVWWSLVRVWYRQVQLCLAVVKSRMVLVGFGIVK